MKFEVRQSVSDIARFGWLMALSMTFLAHVVVAGDVNWRTSQGRSIKSVHYLKTSGSSTQSSESTPLAAAEPTQASASPYPVPPLAGFSPLIVMTTSNKRLYSDDTYEHNLESSYDGSPLNPPIETNYIIGVCDSGAELDLIAGSSADTLGLTGSRLTDYSFPIGGVGGTVDGTISEPIGIFASGLGAIAQNGQIDANALVGHSNTAAVVTPEISCEETGEAITGVIGTPFLSFYTTVIRNDYPRNVYVNERNISSPDVEILDQNDSIPQYSHKIAMTLSGLATTANYYPGEVLGIPTGLAMPTLLSAVPGALPTGGKFITTIYALEGEPGPLNIIQPMRVMVDTGAQSSIITPAMAANLSLPLEGDFHVDVCGVGGLEPNVPGYYVDYVKINALGGALEFSNASFVMIDLPIQDASGNYLDGVLGMNFFWNRNIIFQPNLAGSGFLHVSDPIPYGNADFNFDGDINLIDFSMLASAWMSSSINPEYLPVCDLYLDDKIDTNDLEAFISHWLQ